MEFRFFFFQLRWIRISNFGNVVKFRSFIRLETTKRTHWLNVSRLLPVIRGLIKTFTRQPLSSQRDFRHSNIFISLGNITFQWWIIDESGFSFNSFFIVLRLQLSTFSHVRSTMTSNDLPRLSILFFFFRSFLVKCRVFAWSLIGDFLPRALVIGVRSS